MPLPASSNLQRHPREASAASGGSICAPDTSGIRFGPYTLASAFQPIFSVPHRRLVGHEALLRARSADGAPVSPIEVFRSCRNEQELTDCDRLSRLTHLENYAARRSAAGPRPDKEWLFLNVQPQAFQRLAHESASAQLRELQRRYALSEGLLVLEVLEAETADPSLLAASIAMAREAGILIAIDDFGAGHSNFDRVWRMRPDIVKVDRLLLTRAACDASACRILRQMVSLLHECGAMVLIEGVETRAEALVAIDCDAEMVQGYLFGRPEEQLHQPYHAPEALLNLSDELANLRAQRRDHRRDCTAAFRRAMSDIVARLAGAEVLKAAGARLDEEAVRFQAAARDFLALPGAETCYLLDQDGRQLGARLFAGGVFHDAQHPLAGDGESRWTQRPYFSQAIDQLGQTQVSRPYRSLYAGHLCATVSVAFPVSNDGLPTLRVVCGEFRWTE